MREGFEIAQRKILLTARRSFPGFLTFIALPLTGTSLDVDHPREEVSLARETERVKKEMTDRLRECPWFED